MDIKKILFASALITTLISTGNALATQSDFSPFSDSLTLHFVGASGGDFTPYYQPDNGIDITGANPLPSQDAIITISSQNKVELGYPALTLFYGDDAGKGAACTMILVDGPWSILNFENGAIPTPNPYNCADLIISPITQTGVHQYQLTITKS